MAINWDFVDFKHMAKENHKILKEEPMFKVISMFNFIIQIFSK